MAPQEHSNVAPGETQHLIVIRHGDRWDYNHPEWLDSAKRRGDPPLSTLGHRQAHETGLFLDQLLAEAGFTHDRITWLSSPFLRTLQTSNDALNAFQEIDSSKIKILPEYSIFEMDGHDGELHKDLPDLDERKLYFPRLDGTYESLFVPELPGKCCSFFIVILDVVITSIRVLLSAFPTTHENLSTPFLTVEPRSEFLSRCDRGMEAFHRRFPYSPGTAIVMVTHAAACIGICRAAANATLQDVCAAGPCSIFRLTRSCQTHVWELDHHSKENAMNGYTGHIRDMGSFTTPWNHFGDKSVNHGYTGPPGMEPQRR